MLLSRSTVAVPDFPDKTPKFLGTIIQKYRLREGNIPSAAFQKWIIKQVGNSAIRCFCKRVEKDIEGEVKEKLIPVLKENDMLLPEGAYEKAGLQMGQPLIQMSDFNSLIALSQKHKAPVFGLTDEELEQTGIVLEITKKSMQQFRDLYSVGADRLTALVS